MSEEIAIRRLDADECLQEIRSAMSSVIDLADDGLQPDKPERALNILRSLRMVEATLSLAGAEEPAQ